MSDPSLPPLPPPRQAKLANRLARPFLRFMELEVASAVLLLWMALLALAWANSPWSGSYHYLWEELTLGFSLSDVVSLEMPLGGWVNDALMAVFFFAVGMEIKREMVLGELSDRSRAMLPVIGALGGMVVPASIYLAFHAGGVAEHGWGVPMATDIAFAVAALSVLGSRAPSGLRIFLLALAIVDDLGAVAVIAVFYTAEIHYAALAWAGAGLALCVLLNAIGVRSIGVYVVVGVFVWFETHHSGVHATIAGVALGLITPTDRTHDNRTLVERARAGFDHWSELLLGEDDDATDLGGHLRHHAVRLLSVAGRNSLSPLDFLVNLLERPVAFVIMPLFALANAGVVLDAATLSDPMAEKVGVAVALGLLVGKPVGLGLFCWVAVKLRIAEMPRGVTWPMLLATGVLAGIGFTVALFVTSLAFDDPVHAAGSKIGILAGSVLATVLGVWLLRRALPEAPGPAR